LWSLLKRARGRGWHVGVVPTDRETALAIVRTTRSGRRLLRHCAVHPASEIRAEHVLAPLSHSRDLAHAPVSAVLSAQDYQLVQVEAPEVAPAELRSAVRWKLRDIVNFPVTDAVIDVFDIPEQARYVETRMVFAVAARAEAVRRVVDLVRPRARAFDVIDIPELCLRNLSALLPQDERGVALLALADGFAQLVLTARRTLYLARRIELARRMETLTLDGGAEPGTDTEALAVELQRSLDYYDSHYDGAPIADVVIASGDERAARLVEPLRSETGLNVELLDVRALFEVAPDIEPDTRFPGLVALGAALRTDRGLP
jgi:MSHA biogenesis protein MshI